MNNEALSYEVCRRNGACLKLYGTTIEQIDEWAEAKRAEGSSVETFSNCESLCNRANDSSTEIENGVTGIKISGTLPNGVVVECAPAIAVSLNGAHKSRLIR